jgi:hypothetical protein
VTAGWSNDPAFSDETFDAIYRFSSGTPRMINTLCDRLLLYGFLEELHVLDGAATNIVVTEIEQDSQVQKPEIGSQSAVVHLKSSSKEKSTQEVVTESGSIEDRMRRAELKIDDLAREMRKERALLRKAILIQLDMDQAYDI